MGTVDGHVLRALPASWWGLCSSEDTGLRKAEMCLEPLVSGSPAAGVTLAEARTSPSAAGASGRASGEDVKTVAKQGAVLRGCLQGQQVGLAVAERCC